MKAYTDLDQSRKLAEFLPIESADMVWISIENDESFEGAYEALPKECSLVAIDDNTTPCWSLAALLDILPKGKVLIDDVHSNKYKVIGYNVDTDYYDEPLDTCYEMVLKLHEQKLL